MKTGVSALWLLVTGALGGFILFFFCYWWTGAITLSIAIGIFAVGGVVLFKKFQQIRVKEEKK